MFLGIDISPCCSFAGLVDIDSSSIIILISVDFPHPFGPTIATRSFSFTLKLRPLKISSEPKYLVILLPCITANYK